MGRFISTFHVCYPERVSAQAAHSLRADIAKAMRSLGYQENPAPLIAARQILVAKNGSGKWLAVLDSSTASQDSAVIDQAGEMLAKVSGKSVIHLLVHDDDFLELKLFRDGRQLSAIHSWPGYFQGQSPPSAPAGNFASWADLLAPNLTASDFRYAWTRQASDTNTSPLLRRVAMALGVDEGSSILSVGSNELDPSSPFDAMGFDKLPGPAINARDLVECGLGHVGGVAATSPMKIGSAHRLTAIAHSIGPACAGLRVLAWGDSLDADLIEVVQATLTLGTAPPISLELRNAPSDQGKLFSASRADISLPAGYPGPAEAFARAEHDLDRGIELWMASRVCLDVELRPLSLGDGDFHLALEPLPHPAGLAHWSTRIQIRP